MKNKTQIQKRTHSENGLVNRHLKLIFTKTCSSLEYIYGHVAPLMMLNDIQNNIKQILTF